MGVTGLKSRAVPLEALKENPFLAISGSQGLLPSWAHTPFSTFKAGDGQLSLSHIVLP